MVMATGSWQVLGHSWTFARPKRTSPTNIASIHNSTATDGFMVIFNSSEIYIINVRMFCFLWKSDHDQPGFFFFQEKHGRSMPNPFFCCFFGVFTMIQLEKVRSTTTHTLHDTCPAAFRRARHLQCFGLAAYLEANLKMRALNNRRRKIG